MADSAGDESTRPRTLRLFHKRPPLWVLALAILAVAAAIAFMIYMITSAMEPPRLPEPPMIR